MKKFFSAALTPLFLHGCAAAQTAPIATPIADAAAKDERQAQIVVRDSQGTKNGFPIEAPTQLSAQKTNYPVPQNAIWVAPNGQGNGSSRQNATTIQNALQNSRPDQTLVFTGGLYRTGEINVDKHRLTLQAAPGEEVWLCGSDVVSNWTREGDVWKTSWNTFFGRGKGIDDAYIDPQFPAAGEREMVFVDGQPLFQVLKREDVSDGKFFADKATDSIVIGSDPGGKVVEIAAREKGVGLYVAGSKVRGIGFKHFADRGLHTGARDISIEDCTFFWNAESGFHTSRNEGGLLIRGNLCVANGRKGGTVVLAQNPRLENNRFAFNNVEGYRLSWDAAGLKVLNSPRAILVGNVAENNNSSGLWLDIDCDNSEYYRNIARGNRAIGLFFEVSKGAILAFNLSHDNGVGIQVANSTGARMFNNTLVNNTAGLTVKWTKRKTLDPDDGDTLYETRDNVFENNIVALTKPVTDGLLLDLSHQQGLPATQHVAADGNFYARTVAAAPDAPLLLWSVAGKWNKPFMNIVDVAQETGAEKQGVLLLGDKPLFVNAPNGDFRLREGSAAAKRPFQLPADAAKGAGVPAKVGYAGAFAPVGSSVAR